MTITITNFTQIPIGLYVAVAVAPPTLDELKAHDRLFERYKHRDVSGRFVFEAPV